eukprot:2090137-Alexandrium_andersonii.AAC.1
MFVTQVRKPADLTSEGTALELNARKLGPVSVEQVQRETGYVDSAPAARQQQWGRQEASGSSGRVKPFGGRNNNICY